MFALCFPSLSCNYCSIIILFFEGVRAATFVAPPRDPLLDKFREAVLATGADVAGTVAGTAASAGNDGRAGRTGRLGALFFCVGA